MAAKKEDTVKEEQLSAAELKIAEMLEAAKAEAQRIIDEAKAAVGQGNGQGNGQTNDAERSAEREAELARGEELVEVKLFKDNDKYKEPVFVAVNGETLAIERGVKVKIKRKFAEVLENSDKQDYETSKLIERKSDEFAKSGL